MATETVGGGIIETVALAEAVDWYALCAVTVTEADGTAAGALYMPEDEIVPTAEFPPMLPLTNQLTAVLLVPDTVAANCCDWPTGILEAVGDIFTEIRPLWFPLFPLPAYDAGKQKNREIPINAIRIEEEVFMNRSSSTLTISYNVTQGHVVITEGHSGRTLTTCRIVMPDFQQLLSP